MSRRTKAEIEYLKAHLYHIVKAMKPMTVRQIFYQAVSLGLIAKSEQEYKGTVVRLLTQMRRNDELPWQWIADNTRWMRKPNTHNDLKTMLEESQELYRRALWRDQDAYVEIWLEKDALSGVLYDVTSEWDVPLMVTRGYPSYSYLAQAAQTIAATDKPTYLYYFGDHDPSGVDIPRHVNSELRELANKAFLANDPEKAAFNLAAASVFGSGLFGDGPEIHFKRVAVLPEQIVDLDLQTRPTKKTDTRAKNFKGESVEVDAIHPDTLREMVRKCIIQHIDDEILENTHRIEQAERETLSEVIEGLGP